MTAPPNAHHSDGQSGELMLLATVLVVIFAGFVFLARSCATDPIPEPIQELREETVERADTLSSDGLRAHQRADSLQALLDVVRDERDALRLRTNALRADSDRLQSWADSMLAASMVDTTKAACVTALDACTEARMSARELADAAIAQASVADSLILIHDARDLEQEQAIADYRGASELLREALELDDVLIDAQASQIRSLKWQRVGMLAAIVIELAAIIVLALGG